MKHIMKTSKIVSSISYIMAVLFLLRIGVLWISFPKDAGKNGSNEEDSSIAAPIVYLREDPSELVSGSTLVLVRLLEVYPELYMRYSGDETRYYVICTAIVDHDLYDNLGNGDTVGFALRLPMEGGIETRVKEIQAYLETLDMCYVYSRNIEKSQFFSQDNQILILEDCLIPNISEGEWMPIQNGKIDVDVLSDNWNTMCFNYFPEFINATGFDSIEQVLLLNTSTMNAYGESREVETFAAQEDNLSITDRCIQTIICCVCILLLLLLSHVIRKIALCNKENTL